VARELTAEILRELREAEDDPVAVCSILHLTSDDLDMLAVFMQLSPKEQAAVGELRQALAATHPLRVIDREPSERPRSREAIRVDYSSELSLLDEIPFAPAVATAIQPRAAGYSGRFGSYEVLGTLGEGGMGTVFRAREGKTGKIVALKRVRKVRGVNLEAIRWETRMLGQLQHPGIIPILDEGISEGSPWYAMELVEGQTLSQFFRELWPSLSTIERPTISIASRDPIEMGAHFKEPGERADNLRSKPALAAGGRIDDVLRLFRKICEPLAYLHNQGIVHRDLKPSNILLRSDRTPMLTDFGLTSRIYASASRVALQQIGGRLAGTPMYMSPEQISGLPIDARSDLYALGCLLYEAVTGLVPFAGPDPNRLLHQHMVQQPTPPSQLVTGLDQRLEDLILGLLAKNRHDRIGHAEDVENALAEMAGERPVLELASPAFLYRPELVGRGEILSELSRNLRLLTEGRGSFVCLAGESGIGKTSLAVEFSRQAVASGVRVFSGECVPVGADPVISVYRRAPSLQPFKSLFDTIADSCREHGPEYTSHVLGTRGKVLSEHVPAFASLPGVTEEADPPQLDAEAARRRLVDCLRETIAAFAARGGPVLLVVDDLHWVDEISLLLLAGLTKNWLEVNRFMILGTYRSDETGRELRSLLEGSSVHSITVGRLRSDEVAKMASDMLGVETVPRIVGEFLSHQSEGNPFFAAEYLHAAVREGQLLRRKGQWALEGASEAADLLSVGLPRSIHELALRRLASAGEEARSLAATAAVIGREFDLDLLAEAAEMPTLAAADQTTRLVQAQVLEVTGRGQYRFFHSKLHETAYGTLAEARREQLHRRVGHLLEQRWRETRKTVSDRQLAHHFVQGRQADKAVEYLDRAGEHAFSGFANVEALELFRSALDMSRDLIPPVDKLRLARWHSRLVDANLSLGQLEDARQNAQQSLRLCSYQLPSSRLAWGIGLLGQLLKQLLVGTLKWFKARGSSLDERIRLATHALDALGDLFLQSNRALEGVYCGLRALNLADHASPTEALARRYANTAMILGVRTHLGHGRRWAERAVRMARAGGDDDSLVYCLSRAGLVFMTIPDWTTSSAYLDEAKLRVSEDRRNVGDALMGRGFLADLRGRFEKSVAAFEEVVRVAAGNQNSSLRQRAEKASVHALLRLGRFGEALRNGQTRSTDQRIGSTSQDDEIIATGCLALSYLRVGERDRALAIAVEVLQKARGLSHFSFFQTRGLECMCEVFLELLERSDTAGASRPDLLASAVSAVGLLQRFARAFPVTRPHALTLAGRLEYVRGQAASAMVVWVRAMNLAERLEMPYEKARTQFQMARRMEPDERQAGRDRLEHLAEARIVFQRLKASHDLEEVQSTLTESARVE
jgi:serine/threonine protein kinase/tetratricopeptide (TPR) repeat protein